MFIEPDRETEERRLDLVIAGVQFQDAGDRERFRRDYIDSIFDRRLSPGYADEVVIHDMLPSGSWHWPWLEGWRARFKEFGAVPRMWSDDIRPFKHPESGERLTLDRDQFLLGHTLSMSRKLASSRQTTIVRLFDVLTDEPPSIQAHTRELIEEMRQGSCRVPPFFPGCRTSWMCWPEFLLQLERKRRPDQVAEKVVMLAGLPKPSWDCDSL